MPDLRTRARAKAQPKAFRLGRPRTALRLWMEANRSDITALRAEGLSFTPIAAIAQEDGVVMSNGEAPTTNALYACWERVQADAQGNLPLQPPTRLMERVETVPSGDRRFGTLEKDQT